MRSKFLEYELSRTLCSLERLLEKLEANEYYSDHSKTFLFILKNFTQTLRNHFSNVPPSMHRLLLSLLNFHLIPLVRYVQRSETKEIHWSLIPSLEQIIKKSLGDSYIVVIRPQWHWNYSVLTSDISIFLRNIVKNFLGDEDLLPIDKKIHVISFPLLEKTNFLLHTILGHEIGHFYQEDYFTKKLDDDWKVKTTNELITKLSESEHISDFDKNQPPQQLISQAKEILEIYKGMVREILPDLIGYILLGPSIVFALYNFSLWN